MQRTIAVTPLGRSSKLERDRLRRRLLLSPAANYIGGTDILVDGGTLANIEHVGAMMKLR